MDGNGISKLSERVADLIRRRIADGELKDGEDLGSEASLIEEYGASRPSIREALRILEAEGLLQIIRGARTVKVKAPHVDLPARYMALLLRTQGATVADAYHCRTLIEPAIVKEVAQNASDKAPIILNKIIRRENEALAISDFDAIVRYSNEFHQALIALSGNKSAQLIISMLNKIYGDHYAMVVISTDKDTLEKAIKAHEILVHFIEKGQAERAEQFWNSHLMLFEQLMRNSKSYLQMVEI
jgi:DNA-binding FadR family transcriptional regulator